jgi:hypothetical protein
MGKIALVDTDIYLHYRWFEDIPWLELLDAGSVTIVVPPVTIRQLNAKKDLPSRPRIRKRAGKVLKRLAVLLASGGDGAVQDGVVVKLEDREPTIDFGEHQLVREVDDDHLIATAIMYRGEMPDADIVIVTGDAGLALLAKARRQGIEALRVPENLRLPEEPGPEEERIAELEKIIRRYEERIPKLSLTYANGDQYATFRLPEPLELSGEELSARVEEVRGRYPKMEGSGKITVEAGDVSGLVAALADWRPMDGVSAEEISRYNDGLEEFYGAYSRYVGWEVKFRNMRGRTVELEVLLANDGTAPAQDIDVFMRFPGGLRVTTGEDYPSGPTPPAPPSKPKTFAEALAGLGIIRDFALPSLERQLPELVTGPRNVSAPIITQGESYDVEVHVERAKHGLQQALDPLYVIFDSYEGASSFHINYRILAADVPEPVEGQLHVIVEKG